MKSYKKKFIDLLIKYQCLKFGSFTLKSGRISPYFYNSGAIHDGQALTILGQCYAEAINDSNIAFDMIFGPAYKGIPIVCTTVNAFERDHKRSVPFCFNRKEQKDRGEGGILIGHSLKGRVLVVDDVITSGITIVDTLNLMNTHKVKVAGIVVSLDRQERGLNNNLSAIQEVKQKYGIQVFSIACLEDILTYLKQEPNHQDTIKAIELYQAKYSA